MDQRYRRGLVWGTALAAVMAVCASPAAAQQSSASSTQTASQTTASPNVAVEELVVTGSRIRRNEFTSPDPLTVITAEQAQLSGVATASDMIQRTPAAMNAFQFNEQLTGFVTNGGGGTNTVSLRGLGDQRTLVLLNGRRTGPAGTRGTVGPIDLNVIPASAVERVEILKDGASSIYGSDAVAGVVNVILKNHTDGLELQAYGNATGDGGGNQYRLSGNWGKTFENGYINVAAEYFNQDILRRRDRDDTNCAADYLNNPTTGDRIDYTTPYANNGHFYKCYNQSNNDIGTSGGTLVYRQPGVDYPTAAQGNNVPASLAGIFARQARPGYPATYPYASYLSPYWDAASVISPSDRTAVLFNGAYNLTPGIEAYGEFLYNRRNSEQVGARQLFPVVSNANPNAAIFVGSGLSSLQPIITRPSQSEQHINYYHAVAGLRGKVDLGWMSGLDWDIYGSYTRNDADYKNDIIYNDRVVATTGAAACNPNPAGGNISGFSCSALPAGGIPWFSQRVLSGNFNDQENAFLFAREGGNTTYDQYYVEGTLAGDVFQLPAGMVGASVGFQVRHESIDDNPDRDIAQNNLWGQTSSGRTKGSDDIKEFFGEVSVPLLKDLFLIDELTFDGSVRYTDYKSYGSNTTYKLGLNWQVVPSVRLRGTYGTSFRAPALFELYLANQTGFLGQGSIDPCVNYQDASNPQIQTNCASQGIPTEYTGVSPNGGGSSALIVTGGGKGILKAETSKAATFGVIFTPTMFRNIVDLNVSLDYFEIEVNDEVRQFGSSNILTQCYQSSNFPSNPFCTLFTRDLNPTSPRYLNVLTVNDSYVNVASQKNRGIDLNVSASHDFGDIGRLTVDAQATWQIEDRTQLLGTADPEDYLGTTYGFRGPDFAAVVAARWDKGPWTFHWGVNMIGKGSDTEYYEGDVFSNTRYANLPGGISSSNCSAPNNYCTYYKQYTEFYAIHDASVRRKFEDLDLTATAGIQNIFDERPPGQSAGQFRVGTMALNAYDVFGRRFYINLQKKF